MSERRHLATGIERKLGRARFVIEAWSPLYRDRLHHLGYLDIGGRSFATPWFPDSPQVPRYHERFAASIEEMILQSARLAEAPWDNALSAFLRRVEGTDLGWWLYGSAALAVRGIDVAPRDIDLNVSDADLAGEILEDLLITPVFEPEGWVAKRVGRAFCHAIVEWLAEPDSTMDDRLNPHEQGPYVADLVETVEWRGHRVRVPPLSAQLATCERRGLSDRVALIRAAQGPSR